MKNFKFIFFLSLFVKFVLAAAIPLTSDEAYYWVWSHRMQLSFFDHPPAVAWLFWLGHLFENFASAARWPAVLLGHLTLVVWYFIWQEISESPKDRDKWSWWVAVVLFSPLLGFGSLIVTPDLPVLFFWATSLLFFLRLLRSRSAVDYAIWGASLGLGFCSKYHIVLFVPIALAFLLFEKKWKLIAWKNVAWTLLMGLLFSAPVLIWNYENDFASFRFQLQHGFVRNQYHFYWTWSYVAAQILLLFPSLVWIALRPKLAGVSRLLLYFAWGPLIFFFFSSFKALVEANWPIVAYPAFFAIAVLACSRPKPLVTAISIWIFTFTVILSNLIYSWLPAAPEKLHELTQYSILKTKPREYNPLYASTYQMASWIWFENKEPFFKLHGISRFDLFDTFPEGQPSKNPFYIAVKKDTEMPNWIIKNPSYHVTEVEALKDDFVILKVEK